MRLDNYVAEKLGVSRTRAQVIVKDGGVFVDGKNVDKPSFDVSGDENITINQKDFFVSRGAHKLARAVEVFSISLADKVVLDMGASTGGFTQVSLTKGARKVYSVDVGHGELDKSLLKDSRVVNMEGTDIRALTEDMVGDSDIVVGDLSFISLKHILPKVKSLFGKKECVLLFKPQFECGKDVAKKCRGVIKDKVIHKRLLLEFLEEIKILDFTLSGITYSPIKGKEGNIEYLIHINGRNCAVVDVAKVVDEAFRSL